MIVRIFVTIFLYKIPIQTDFMLTDGIIKKIKKTNPKDKFDSVKKRKKKGLECDCEMVMLYMW